MLACAAVLAAAYGAGGRRDIAAAAAAAVRALRGPKVGVLAEAELLAELGARCAGMAPAMLRKVQGVACTATRNASVHHLFGEGHVVFVAALRNAKRTQGRRQLGRLASPSTAGSGGVACKRRSLT